LTVTTLALDLTPSAAAARLNLTAPSLYDAVALREQRWANC